MLFSWRTSEVTTAPTTVGTPKVRWSGARPPVVLIPGMCGSRLHHDELMTWPCTIDLLRSFDLMHWRDERLHPRGIINQWDIYGLFRFTTGYGRLRDLLTDRYGYEPDVDLFEFAYDWRQDCRQSAEELAEQVQAWQRDFAAAGKPLIVLAHSMGGLIARYWIEHLGGASHVGHLGLFGSPAEGAPLAFEWLAKGAPFVPWQTLRRKLAGLVRTMPSMYQLLPLEPFVSDPAGNPVSIFESPTWLPDEFHPLLAAGRAFQQELSRTSSVPTFCVVGDGLETATRAMVDLGHPLGWDGMQWVRESAGDGMVPAVSAGLPGVPTLRVGRNHEDVLSAEEVWRWLTPRLFGDLVEGPTWELLGAAA